MKRVTVKEARRMLGTEFDYVFEDDDKIRAFVKAFDPEVGLTCYTLESKTKAGWAPSSWFDDVEEDGTFCVVAFDFKHHSLEEALEKLGEIRDTGEYHEVDSIFGGTVSCAFM